MRTHRTGLRGGRLRSWIVIFFVLLLSSLQAVAASALSRRLDRILKEPELAHAMFGLEVLSVDTGKAIVAIHADKMFTPGSTTKLLTEGAALELLGPNFRFRTRLYRTGPILEDGTLDGDLVWVASGLAGYITTASGKRLAFAAFVNHATAGAEIKSVERVSEALAKVAEAIYETTP